jgi:hypothetical protein
MFRIGALLLLVTFGAAMRAATPPTTIPPAHGTALDGHSVSLPRDLSGGATILILGFTQHSQDATTAWEKPVRTALAGAAIGFYDMPFLEDAPSLLRPLIVRSIRKQVPDALQPRFLPLTSGEATWKQVAGFSSAAPDAAYVLLVDRNGTVLWQTHDPFSQTRFDQLTTAARTLASAK